MHQPLIPIQFSIPSVQDVVKSLFKGTFYALEAKGMYAATVGQHSCSPYQSICQTGYSQAVKGLAGHRAYSYLELLAQGGNYASRVVFSVRRTC